MNIVIMLTAHNRKINTLMCLKAIYEQVNLPSNVQISVFLVDDGSSDGTSLAVSTSFPQVIIFQGSGNLYWCGGMQIAFSEAMKKGFDYYLWLNDDTILYPKALAKLLSISNKLGEKCIVVGSLQDPDTGDITYGGLQRQQSWRPLRFTLKFPGTVPLPVETMNGNCVLIPQAIVKGVGNLDKIFTHTLGDLDYGLRARKQGFKIFIGPGFSGFCKRNHQSNLIFPWNVRWKWLFSKKGLPPCEWALFAKRYAGPFWFIFWLSPYLNFFLRRR